MRNFTLVLFAAVCLLAAAPAAGAKEVLSAQACGAEGCVALGKRMLDTSGDAQGPTRPAAFYRLRFVVGDENGRPMDRFTLLYVPSQRLARGEGGPGRGPVWSEVTPASARRLRGLLRSVEPVPAARLPLAEPGPGTISGALAPKAYPPEPVAASASAPGGGVPAWPFAAVGAALLALGGVLLAARRRRGAAPRAAPRLET